jgi:oligosaccharide reducing-end xylanase
MGMQEQFNQLWRFAKTFMQYGSEPTGDLQAWRLYFRWSGTVNSGNASNWVINFPADQSPASDGEEYFAAALYLADRRWGSAGEINYQSEADQLTHAMLNNPGQVGGRTTLIHPTSNMVTFVPYGSSAEHTDPSYHLPAFYELFAQDGPQVNRDRWLQIAEVSRQFFVASANATTGLHPDYAQFDGAPTEGYNPPNDRDTFAFDAWRVPMNMAIDYVWTGADARLETQIGKYMTFFANRVGSGDVMGSAYTLDGTPTNTYGSQGLTAALAVASQVGDNGQLRTTLLNNLWDASYPTGTYRYYQSSVYVLGMLAASGKYAFGWPQAQ